MPRRLAVLAALALILSMAPTIGAEAAAIDVSPTKETTIREKVRAYAWIQALQDAPYCYGGTGPVCFDCSGLVVAAYRYAGVCLACRGLRTSTQLRRWTTATTIARSKTGDLLFYDGHVEMVYVRRSGYREAISATHTGGPPVNRHPIRYRGLLKVGKVVT